MDELGLAFRRLTRRPAVTVVSVVALAFAIGAAAATWSLLSAVLRRPLPVKEADRLVVAGTVDPRGRFAGIARDGFVYPVFPAIRDSGIFAAVAAEWATPPSFLTSTGATPVRASIGFATFNFTDLLGVAIPLGRGFTAADDRRGAPAVAILTDGYWRRAFGARPDAIGTVIAIKGKPVIVIGVAQPGFRGLNLSGTVDLYLPFHTIADIDPGTTNYFAEPNPRMAPTSGTRIVARLREGTSAVQAAAQLASLRILAPGGGARPAHVLTPINVAAIPAASRPAMTQFSQLLAVTVALLLLIGCGTVGILLLIRTEARRDELALCIALGASRGRLARGIIAEGALLAAAGALTAVPVASWLFKGIRTSHLPGGIDIGSLGLHVDRHAVAAAAAGAVLATVLLSLIAASVGLAAGSVEALRSRGGATPRIARRRTRAALVVGQVAVAMVLVAGAGLFARSLTRALHLNAGLEMDHIVTGTVDLRPYGYDPAGAAAFFTELEQRLRGNPAVKDVASSIWQGGMGGKLAVDAIPRQFGSDVWFTAVDESYFRTIGLRLSAGRAFTPADRSGAPLVAIVSESFARHLAGGADALGRRITMPWRRADAAPEVVRIVGVVGDVVTRVSVLEPLDMYFPLRQSQPSLTQELAVRAARDADAARVEVLGAIRAIDASVAPLPLLSIEERIARQMAPQQLGRVVLGTLGSLAIFLTALGTFVLGESMAVMRMREMGVRAALGASRRQLATIVLAQTGRLVGLGLLLGLTLVWLGANMIRSFLFQITPFDPLTLAGVAALILTLTLMASVRPALRVARVDLGTVLREQ